MKRLCIIGASGTAGDILSLIKDLNKTLPVSERWKCIGLLDDNKVIQSSYCGLPILGNLSGVSLLDEDIFFAFAIGSIKTVGIRKNIFERLGLPDERFPCLVHPKSVVDEGAIIGDGSIVLPNVTISRSVTVGRFCHVLPGTVINHNTSIGEFTCLASGVMISGNVKIGAQTYIGTNTSIREELSIGCNTLIGLGSAVVSSIEGNSLAYGVPCKVVKRL